MKNNTRLGVSRAPLSDQYSSVAISPGLADLLVVYFEGIVVGTLVFEVSFDSTDGVNGLWRAISASVGSATNSSSKVTSVSFTGASSQSTFYVIRNPGAQWVRVRLSAHTSGSAVCVIEARNQEF